MTIARLQQLITLGLAGLGAVWVTWSLGGHAPTSGPAASAGFAMASGALLVLVLHAPVLAIEMIWAASAARRPLARRPLGSTPQEADRATEPYPSVWCWLQAWAREVFHGVRVFGWQQPWRHAAQADFLPGPAAAQGRRGVLLVHGFVCNRGFWNTWMPRLRAAGIPHVAVTLNPPFADIRTQAQCIEQAWRTLEQCTGRAPLLVGHSMGGLVLRTWLSGRMAHEALMHELITIGSPHHGTALAQFAQSQAAQEMQLLSPFLQELAAAETPERRARMTCYWSVCDNIVFPAHTATLPGARNIHLPGHPHVGLSQAPEILRDVMARTAMPS